MAAAKRPKGNLEPLEQLLGNALHNTGLGKRLQEYKAVEAWDEVVGDLVAEHSNATGIREGTLFVDVTSSVWMQELQLLRGEIIERLNAHLGRSFVKQVVLSMQRTSGPHAQDRR